MNHSIATKRTQFAESKMIYKQQIQNVESQKSPTLEMTTDQKEICEEIMTNASSTESELSKNLKKIVKLFKEGKIDLQVLRAARDVSKTPKLRENENVKEYVKAVAMHKFKKGRKLAIQLFHAITGSEEEVKYARDEINGMVDEGEGVQISAYKEMLILKGLAERNPIKKMKSGKSAQSILEKIKEEERKQTNWEIPSFDEEKKGRIDSLERTKKQLIKNYEDKESEIEQEEGKASPDEAKIQKAKEELKRIDRKIEEMMAELNPLEEEVQKHMQKSLARYETLEDFFNVSGVNILKAKKIQVGERVFEVNKVRFLDDVKESNQAGSLMVDYIANGKREEIPHSKFLELIEAGQEIIDERKILNERIYEETYQKYIEEGQNFIIYKETIPKETEFKTFKIHKIDDEEQKITIKEGEKTKDLDFGEFVKFIKQNKYRRKVEQKEVEEEIGKTVVILDKNRHKRWGKIKRNEEDGTYAFEEEDMVFEDESQCYQHLLQAGVPPHILSAHSAQLYTQEGIRRLTPNDIFEMREQGRLANRPTQQALNAMLARGGTAPLVPATAPGGPTPPGGAPPGGSSSSSVANAPGDPNIPSDIEDPNAIPGFYPKGIPPEFLKKPGKGQSTKQIGFLRDLWSRTYFLSMSDMWQLGKSFWEYYVRSYERNQKKRLAKVSENMPWYGSEARRLGKEAENEEVNKFKEAYQEMNVEEVQAILGEKKNLCSLKAAFIVLSEKGRLRWDDIDMWKNLNSILKGKVHIYIPPDGDPETRNPKDGKRGLDSLEEAIDELWESGQYGKWRSSNSSAYKSGVDSNMEFGRDLASRDGGHKQELSILLKMHKRGITIDPHRYEGIIVQALSDGKSTAAVKLYYLIEGVAAKNQYGRTIMPFSRIGYLATTLANNFPALDYLTASTSDPDPADPMKRKERLFSIKDFENWANFFDDGQPGNPEKCEPPKEKMANFINEYALLHREVRERISKMFHDGKKMDHDDAPHYVPLASVDDIEKICRLGASGSPALSAPALLNGFVGYNNLIKVYAERNLTKELKQVIQSYIRYWGILTDRYKQGENYQRVTTLEVCPVVDRDTPTRKFVDEINVQMENIVTASGSAELRTVYEQIKRETLKYRTDDSERDESRRRTEAFEDFNRLLEEQFSLHPERLISAIDTSKLKGS
jgi:hypothetical protein